MCLGIPGKVVEIHQQDDLPIAKVEFGGILKDVCLSYTPEARIGDYVLVHVGFAISRMDEAEARETIALIEQIESSGQWSVVSGPGETANGNSLAAPSSAPRPHSP